jgi:SAM-dependent methyltransferase
MATVGAERREALVGRLFESALGLMDLAAIHIGDRLGLYAALAGEPGLTAAQLAARTGTQERYVREWLEQQAVSGLLEVDDGSAASADRGYRIAEGCEEVFLDPSSLEYMAPMARMCVGLFAPMPQLLTAFRDGGGVAWEDYGADVIEAQAAANRPHFEQLLGTQWLPAIPDVDARLRAQPPARVADIACGGGWSSIAIARAYPLVHVDGSDLDTSSIELARRNAREAGVEDRVEFHLRDGSDPQLAGTYDLVTVFEAIHDMSQPVPVLATMRRLAADAGTVLVMDEKVADRFTAPGDDMERFFYGASILCCLPAGMADKPSVGTGTVMRSETMRDYARQAGFSEVEVLPIDHDIWRFYRLRTGATRRA